jgi:hypothetical protein
MEGEMLLGPPVKLVATSTDRNRRYGDGRLVTFIIFCLASLFDRMVQGP